MKRTLRGFLFFIVISSLIFSLFIVIVNESAFEKSYAVLSFFGSGVTVFAVRETLCVKIPFVVICLFLLFLNSGLDRLSFN